MAGYENFMAVIYHSGPSFLGCQSLRVKIMNMETRDCRVLIDADCAITPGSVLTWMGFSEEGQIFTYDSDGILRSFSYTTQSWSVRLSFDTIRQRLQDSVRSIWIVGISDQEVLYIELGQDHEAPMLTQK